MVDLSEADSYSSIFLWREIQAGTKEGIEER